MNQHLYRWKTATWVAGLLLLPLWSAGQDYFNFPREHTRVFHLSNGDSIQVRALEIWRQIGHVTVLCNSWTGNSYSPTLYYRTGFSIDPIDRNRLNNDFTAIFDIPAFERTGNDEDPIPSDWLETFEQKLKDHLGETPYVVDFSSPSEFTQHRGIGEVHRFLNGFSNFTPCPSCDGMLYFVFQYQVQYFILYNDPVQSYPKSIEFIQYHPTYHLDCHQLPCDCSWKPECRQACCIPVEGGEICAMLDSTRCISSTVRGRSLTEGTSCNPDPCNEPTADDASKSRIPTDENGLPIPFPKDLICKVRGTGRTTGHVITLTLTNPTADTITYLQTPYIISPTLGENGVLYQGFGTEGYAIHDIPPGQTLSIPLNGVCLNLDLQPPTGPVTPVDTWATPFTAPALPPPYAELPVGSGFAPVTDDGQKNLSLTYPGTDVPFPYTFDMKGDLTEAAGLLFGVVGNIKTSFGNLKTEGQINSPYSGNPELEELIFTQQPVWIATSLLNGDPYTEDAFQTNLEGQYRDNYGVDISQAPAAVQTEFKEGVTNMWASFTLVGEGAKILTSNPPTETEEEPDFGCGYEQDMTFHPPYCFAMKISENWANEEDRTRIIAATEEALAGSWTNADEVFGQYDISHNPTSATAFWKALNIGGFASGYAKTYFNQSGGSSEWVSHTEQLSVDTSGSSDAWLSLTNDQFCSSFVVGVSLSRLRASSRAFDAMAGNEYGEDDQGQLNFLKGTKFFAKLALKYLIQSKTGQTGKSFGAYARDAIRNQISGEISEAVYAEAEKLGIGFLDELVAALQVESLQDLLDMGQEQLGSMLSDVLGFNPLDLMGEAMDVIDEGLDATLNLFFWSNTSATANGALVISVGRQRDALQVHSQILYTREAQEATSEAMQGSGEKCGEMLLSDVLPGELHITTEGLASLTARASGNGNASAYLESQHLQVFVGVCICRDQDKPTVVSFVNHGWYTQARDPAMDQVQGEVEQDLDEFLKEKIDGGELTKESSQRDWKAAVEGFVRVWGEKNAFCK